MIRHPGPSVLAAARRNISRLLRPQGLGAFPVRLQIDGRRFPQPRSLSLRPRLCATNQDASGERWPTRGSRAGLTRRLLIAASNRARASGSLDGYRPAAPVAPVIGIIVISPIMLTVAGSTNVN